MLSRRLYAMPAPNRILVLPFPNGSQATPGAWAKQPFLGVLRQQTITDHRFRQQNAAGPRNQIGGVVKFVVVAIRELVPQTQTQRQVRSKLDRVLYEPGAQPRAPRHHTRVELNRELRGRSFQEGFEVREDGLSPIEIELRILEPLEPDSRFQRMDAPADLNLILVRVEVGDFGLVAAVAGPGTRNG